MSLASQKNAKVEMLNNDAEQKRLHGTLVLYGQTIQVSIVVMYFY